MQELCSNILPKTETKIDLIIIITWEKLPWKKYQLRIEKIQRSIYHAAKCGNNKKVRDLQRLLLHSRAAKAVAIKKITQLNKGRRTAGLDGKVYITDESRLKLLSEIEKDMKYFFSTKYKPTPIRRVYIPKSDGSKRPLGIPTIRDRIFQELCRMALEPEWEAKFHRNSFGFRSGRGCQDAIEVIKTAIYNGFNHILDADLHKCFDNLSHEYILEQLTPPFKQIIKKWLNTKVVDMGQLKMNKTGTPQGGVISPLLANIALNILDHTFNNGRNIILIRYADDFLVLSRSEQMLKEVKLRLQTLLKTIGPTLNEAKTTMTTPQNGFSFLGFHFVRYPRRTLWVQPDKKRVKSFLRRLKELLMRHKQVETKYLIAGFNSRIRGWTNYYQFCRTHEIYSRMEHVLWHWIWEWCKRRHPRKGKRWVFERYYMGNKGEKWCLTADGFTLRSFFDNKRKKYTWRVGDSSPFDWRKEIQKLWQKKKEGIFYVNGYG